MVIGCIRLRAVESVKWHLKRNEKQIKSVVLIYRASHI